jgi:hypothetical protein
MQLKLKGNEAFSKQNLAEAKDFYDQSLKASEGWQTKRTS